jgi:asparaginyl-tRNA synthetase
VNKSNDTNRTKNELVRQSMAEKIYIKDIAKHENQEVTIEGWLYNKRSSGKLRFLLLRDGTETIQCVVFKGDVSDESFAIADTIQQESSCQVTGTVSKDERSPIGFEVQV